MKRKEFTRKIKAAAFLREVGLCCNCKVKLTPTTGIQYDHIIPLELCGDDSEKNCAPLCRNCHAAKTVLDQGDIARARSVHDKHFGIKQTRSPIRGWRGFDGRPIKNPRLER